MTAFKRSQAKYAKKSYRTTNWPEYEAGLRDRGSLTVWISEDELTGWAPPSADGESLEDRSSTPTTPSRQP